uniref:Uncharacterized protein n=1 Tax=Scophthalmus maximus TaxID=52904 RepID=A0A8D3DH43_SCOMX
MTQPPPSYDQVIQEKTQEGHAVRPTAAPRCSTCIATSATQTDPVRGDTTPTDPRGGEAPQSAEKRSAAKKPQKPPRPSLPRPGDREPVTGTVTPTGTDGTVGTNTTASTNAEDQSGSISDIKRPSPPHPTHTSTRSVTVYWDIPANHLSAPAAPAETTSPSNSEPRQCPVPLPRTRSRKPATAEEVKVQPLVEVSENCDTVHSDREDFSSNKYLKELLEAFSAEDECEQTGDIANQSDEACQREDAAGEMNAGHSQRNIRARIQAFESQADAEEGSVPEPARPEPRPRKATAKPPVAAKPSVALKPQFNHSTDEDSQNFSSANVQISTPRPQPPEKIPGLSIKEELESIHSKAAFPNRSRPSVLTRANSIYGEETSPAPPVPPAKPFKEPLKPNLNINNHNSASISESEYVNSQPNHIPAEPPASADSNGASFKRQTLTRRPTTIRVPSKTGSRESSELTHDCWKMSFLSKYTQVMSHLPMPGWIMGTRFQHVMLTTSSLFSLRFFSGRSSTSPRSEARGLPPRLGGPQTGLHARPPVPGVFPVRTRAIATTSEAQHNQNPPASPTSSQTRPGQTPPTRPPGHRSVPFNAMGHLA